MYKKIYFIFIIISSFFITYNLNAQEKVISGLITTFDSIPLNGAKIEVKSTKIVVLSDTLGRFSVVCNLEDKLKVTANGFYKQNVKITKKIKIAAINLKLKPGAKSREYAIGYGHVLDKEKLNAVANLNNKDIDFSQYSNMSEIIRGRFAGVQIVNDQIIIRGINSINSSSAALIVIDGIPTNYSVLNSISPTHVKSINVIKDGSAAIYGSRGSNGVLIVETKRGGDL
ncbi:MAG: TonB-dependent receptor plug domain-containing protein [Draconibacterium sp.]|nr:TonB-dependent receptor plug domain-containing protein [Draconibacterium sp.]